MANDQLNPKVLGQLLLMQSFVINLPDKKSIFSFVCRGLVDIPGISKVIYLENEPKESDNSLLQEHFPVLLGDAYFGNLVVNISDIKLYEPYRDYLKNFIFMIGVVLEERNQRQLNEQNQLLLEQRILERTQQLNLEKENLAESQRRFLDLMLNVKLLTVMLDEEGNVIFCNPYLLNLTGYTQNEVLGKNWFDLFLPKPIVAQVKEIFYAVMNGAEPTHNYENEILTKDGEVLMIAWNNTMLYDANRKIIGTASIGENITERKKNEILIKQKTDEIEAQNEEYSQINEELIQVNEELQIAKEHAEESDRLKTAFLQNLSHEIRTPMNAIMGFSDLLYKCANDPAKLKKFTDIISQRCNDLLDIINDILDISKIESGQLPVNVEACDLNELFGQLSSFFSEYQKRINKGHIRFTYKILFNESKNLIFTDKTKLKQIFINLINNSFKFTEEGNIEFGCKLDSQNSLLFYVSDTGIGIPPGKHGFIFERFSQLQQGSKRNTGGTGLGLPIVKALVTLLGGEIFLESIPNKGSCFSFTIPYKSAEHLYHKPLATDEPNIKKMASKVILIVEDDPYNAEYLKEILSDNSSTILLAETGQQAIDMALSQSIDIVLMDIRLPDMNGYEAIFQIRQNKPRLKIIAQTAYAAQDEKQRAFNAGCIDYISKPTKQEVLLDMLNKHLT